MPGGPTPFVFGGQMRISETRQIEFRPVRKENDTIEGLRSYTPTLCSSSGIYAQKFKILPHSPLQLYRPKYKCHR
jgi:hypothetical protein